MQNDWEARSHELDLSKYTFIITDVFPYFLQDVADNLGIPRYVLCTSPCDALLYLTQGDKIIEARWLFENPEKRNQFIKLPGLESFTPIQTPRRLGLLRVEFALPLIALSLRGAAGLLINTFEAYDKEPMEVLSRQLQFNAIPGKVPARVFSIGPLLALPKFSESFPELPHSSTHTSSEESSEITDWLDKQQKSSVLFISTGSIRRLSQEATTAFAKALEETKITFLWVLRLPPQCSRDDSLTTGFEARTEAQGIVRTDWVPQQRLLQHPSIGGFLSYCGWNSILESIYAGVPIAACPMYAEQGMNSKRIAKMQIAIEVEYKSDLQDFGSETVAAAISALMNETTGGKLRQNMQNIQKEFFEANAEGDLSHQSFQEFLAEVIDF